MNRNELCEICIERNNCLLREMNREYMCEVEENEILQDAWYMKYCYDIDV